MGYSSWGLKEPDKTERLAHAIYWASQVALVVKNPSANAGSCKRHGFDPLVGKIPWRRA